METKISSKLIVGEKYSIYELFPDASELQEMYEMENWEEEEKE